MSPYQEYLGTYTWVPGITWDFSTLTLSIYNGIMPVQTIPCLTVHLPEEKAAGFAALLQHGMLYQVEQSVAMGDFLLSLPGFSREYLEETVQTIFLNGVAADSFAAPLVSGSTLALSAAMPGLAGAIFRREGRHGSLRSQTGGTRPGAATGSGYIKLKLFNKIATDKVAALLAAGILVEAKDLCAFAGRRGDLFQTPGAMELNSTAMPYEQMLQALDQYSMVTVRTAALPGKEGSLAGSASGSLCN